MFLATLNIRDGLEKKSVNKIISMEMRSKKSILIIEKLNEDNKKKAPIFKKVVTVFLMFKSIDSIPEKESAGYKSERK